MNETKSIFTSKVAWTAIVTFLFTVLKGFGILPEGLTEPMVVDALYSVAALAIVVFRFGKSKDVTLSGAQA